jgi:hypothetical protein
LNSAQIAHHPCPDGWLSDSQNKTCQEVLKIDWTLTGRMFWKRAHAFRFFAPIIKKAGIADGNQLWQHVNPSVSDPLCFAQLSRPSFSPIFLLSGTRLPKNQNNTRSEEPADLVIFQSPSGSSQEFFRKGQERLRASCETLSESRDRPLAMRGRLSASLVALFHDFKVQRLIRKVTFAFSFCCYKPRIPHV